MPIYEYECGPHGTFELERSMAESSAGAPCPTCRETARRIVSAPNLGNLPRSTVRALDRNEKNRHEPRLVRREKRAETSESASGIPRARSHPGGRPWVLEHG
ncbi:MAG TPA: zinc ribbon domain-containing protein [Polyangiaceae bacterium]